jgi:ribosome-binding protein aMBF1 (putative translation factor)
MRECFFCGVSEERAILYEVIGKEGVIPVCRKCYFKENEMPVVEKKDLNQVPHASVRERLSKMNHLPVEKEIPKAPRRALHDVSLNDLIEKNYRQNLSEVKVDPSDLVPNFHWVVMRKRRHYKISQGNLAERVSEPTVAIEFLEKGILPQDYENLIKKVEEVLKIQLFKEPRKIVAPVSTDQIPESLTVGEIKEGKKKGFFSRLFGNRKEEVPEQNEAEKTEGEEAIEEANEEKAVEASKEDAKASKEEPKPVAPVRKDLSQKEINDLIFSKKK